MSSGCGDVLSLADLQTAKKHQIFEAEVITGKSGGVAEGADIDYATNQVTGQVQKTLPAVLRDAGFSPVSWDFSTGGTLTVNDRDKVVYDPVSKTWYSYAGALPVTVPASFNPVGNADWNPQTDPQLRSFLLDNKMVRYSLLNFGADPTGSQDSTAAVMAADTFSTLNGTTILVPKGNYLVLNAQLGGSYYFEDDAFFVGNVAANDNIVVANSGLRMINPKFKKTDLEAAPDGDYGSAIRFGVYRQPAEGSNHHNFYIENLEVYTTTSNAYSYCVVVAGDVYDLVINGAKIYGRGAIITHWGGDVGADGHASTVTYSYHPHDIRLSNLKFLKDENDFFSSNSLIISACYNVTVDGIYTQGANRSVWVLPGDVYNEVAVSRDKGKVCTGITIDNVCVDEPTQGNPAIHLTGVPATKRTSQVTYYGFDQDSTLSYTVKGTIQCRDIVYSSPLVTIEGCKTSTVDITKSGGNRSSGYWAVCSYCTTGSVINLTGVSVLGVRVRGCNWSSVCINGERQVSGERNGSEGGCSIESFRSAAFTINDAITSASSSMTVVSSADGVLIHGAYIMVGGVSVGKVSKSTLCPAGIATVVEITSVNSSVDAGSSAYAILPCEGTTVSGSLSNFLVNYRVIDPIGLTLNVESNKAYRTGILISGDFVKGTIINGIFSGTGHENSSANRSDIAVSDTAAVQGLTISGQFDVNSVNPYVQNRFRYLGTNHTGLKFINCFGTVCSSGVSFNISHSTVTGFGNQPQIIAVSLDANVAPAEIKVGQYLGHAFVGNARNGNAPTLGYWTQGSRLYIDTVTAGGQEGYICTASGTPGTWKGFGSISS